ncbi:hypothetical protein FH039_04820 [Thermococcus indicus]|uniref:Big-1 domain-containing protein n=1 Tax=Thermococcus indicus TaxID=2586643 RepID=A0A4Y5SM63_9EURY|nr:hypothetical protein [Thermococcus indicus]QDA31060.1 hypothetical protein FH039_04820 [Thermococcus indicus]
MKLRGVLIIILLTAMLPFLPPTSAQSPLVIVPLNSDFSGVPGDTIIIPFRLENLGNQTLENVSVYITGPAEGFLYQSKVIREPIEPNQTYQDTLSVKILNADTGRYTLKLVARTGNTYSEAPIEVKVRLVVDYSLYVISEERYIYGHDVPLKLKAVTGANGVLTGRIGYHLSHNGHVIKNVSLVTYIRPDDPWEQEILLPKPGIGEYTLTLWANFSGVFKEVSKTFIVYQRNLTYRAFYRDGSINVEVYGEDGKGVRGIPVSINGTVLTTDENGRVIYAVSTPGTYRITLNLDGRIAHTTVNVNSLQMTLFQNKTRILVTVTDTKGNPLANVTVVAVGPKGTDYRVTDASGIAVVNLEITGYGTIMIRATSSRYLGTSANLKVAEPEKPSAPTTTSSSSPTTTTPQPPTTTIPSKPPRDYGPLAAILLIAGVILAGSSYMAFFRPTILEETLDRYYFVKVKAPRLNGVDNFRFERSVNAVEVRATKGRAKIEDGRVVWEIEHLEPEEEAYLQVILG